ncbi:MAG: hypothetical protein SO287_06490 [Parabacteroides sp.]|nr:hypothetical protein [Parabacteroides sp.]
MDVELIISGTPEGQDYYGPEESRQYMSLMYSASTDNKLMIDVRKEANGKTYCYYNYLVYKDVIGVGGRPGSYFCLALRLDAYCMDIQSMYRLLDITYHNYVKNAILKVTGSKVQYKAGNFNDLAKEIERVKDFIFSNFQCSFTETSFTSLQGFVLNNGQIKDFNLSDYSAQALTDYVRKGGKMNLSPTFSTEREKQLKEQHEKQLQAFQQQTDAARKLDIEQKNKLNADLSSAKQEISLLKATIADLQKKNKEIEMKLRTMGQAKELEQMLESVKTPILKIADHIKAKAPVYAERMQERTEGTVQSLFEAIRKVIPFCNLLLLLFLLTLNFPKQLSSLFSSSTDNETIRGLRAEIAALQQNNSDLEAEVAHLRIKQVEIDVDGYSKGTLDKKKQYQVQALLKNTFDWKVEGADVEKDKSNGTIILIKPKNDQDTVRIHFFMNGEQIQERIIPNP